jgi:AcrR family transcriptional regulator
LEPKRKINVPAQTPAPAEPKRPKPVREKVSKRRDEILQVAARLFAEKGYEETTIREIGDAAGILSGSLYHHFQTKEEMLHELLKRFISMGPEYQAIVDKGKGARDTLCDMIVLGLKAVVNNPHIVSITVHERKFLARHPSFTYVEDAWRANGKIWYGVLQRGVSDGIFREDLDLHLLLRMINDLMAAAVDWYRPNGRYSINKIIDTQIALILGGIER